MPAFTNKFVPTTPTPGIHVQAPTPANTAGRTAAPTPAANPQPLSGVSIPTSIPTEESFPPMALVSVDSNPYPANTAAANPIAGHSPEGYLVPANPDPTDPAAENPAPETTVPGNSETDSPEHNSSPERLSSLQNKVLASIIANALGLDPDRPPPAPLVQTTHPNQQQPPVYTISLAPSASALIINGIATPIPTPASTAPALVISINSQPTALSAITGVDIAGQFIAPGAPASTIKGVAVSLAPSATAIVVGGVTTLLSPGPRRPDHCPRCACYNNFWHSG